MPSKPPKEPSFTGPLILLSIGAVLSILGLLSTCLEHQYEASHPKPQPTISATPR